MALGDAALVFDPSNPATMLWRWVVESEGKSEVGRFRRHVEAVERGSIELAVVSGLA